MVSKADDTAKTNNELAAMFGMGRTAIKDRIRRLVVKGKVEVVKKYITDSKGRTTTVPAYRIKER